MTLWDYSKVPLRTWKWYLNESDDHWMELEIEPSTGLRYIGTDWSCQSGGAYFGGFQTFDEFFRNGPINDMPEEIATELRNHLETNRVSGGSRLLMSHLNTVTDLILWRAYVHLDDKPLLISVDDDSLAEREVVFFEGAIETGEHEISFLLVFKSTKNDKPSQWRVKGEFDFSVTPGTNKVQLKTFRDTEDRIMLVYEENSSEKRASTEI
ncbi:MAG: hypothetical protein ACW963_02860 [Candidatus Sifarchaeia archaeon]